MNNKERLITNIDNRIQLNEYYMENAINNAVRGQFASINDVLLDLKNGILRISDEEYERGLNDAWELARKIGGGDVATYDAEDLLAIFGFESVYDIFDKFEYQEAMDMVAHHEKKKEEAKLKYGDVVTAPSSAIIRSAVFLAENSDSYWVLIKNEPFPQRLSKNGFHLVKTGKRVDLDGLFTGI